MIPALIAQIGLPLLMKAVGAGLSRLDNPVADAASKALGEVEGALATSRIDPEKLAAAEETARQRLEIELAHDQRVLSEVNRSLRAEIASSDPYVRRMRPTFGYIMALSWAAQMGAIAWVIAVEPAQAANVVSAMASLGTIWTVGLSVLGIYVYKRSREKEVAAGAAPVQAAQALGETLGRVFTRKG